jgi:O-antigen/teichoic acid export membrane protein
MNNKVLYLIIGSSANSLFTLFFLIMTYISIGKIEFSYLTGLFIFENILIVFDLSINNYIIKNISSEKIKEKKKIINYFFKRIIIFSIFFYIINYFFLKEIFWNRIINDQSKLILFITFIIPFIIVTRIFINFFRAILIGNNNQIKTAKIQIISSFLKFIIFIFFLFFFKTIQGLLTAYLLCNLIELLLYIIATYKKFIINLFIYNDDKIKDSYNFYYLKYFFFLSLSIVFFFNIDRVFLSYKVAPDILGEYNFIRTLLLGFFILSSAYFYTLLTDISGLMKNNHIIKLKISQSFISLNIILIFSIVIFLFFFEKFIYDFKLESFFKIKNFLIFKIILIATYFNLIGSIFLSFQIARSYLKIPTLINFAIFILSLIFIDQIFINYNIEGVAILYLLMNLTSFLINALFLNLFYGKIFTKKLFYNFFKNTIYYFSLAIVIMNFMNYYVYFFSKVAFYFFLTIIFFFAFYKSQKYLKS